MTAYFANAEEAHRAACERGAKCEQCPLYGARRGPVMGELRPSAKLIVIAEAPGKSEIPANAPLVGPPGQEFERGLREAGASRDDVSITNVILCQPTPGWSLDEYLADISRKNRKSAEAWAKARAAGVAAGEGEPLPATPPYIHNPVTCCAPRLERDIRESGATAYLALGAHALKAVAHLHNIPFQREPDSQGRFIASISEQAGAPVDLRPSEAVGVAADGGASDAHTRELPRFLCSTWHPAFGLRDNRQYLPIIRRHIGRALSVAHRGSIDWQWSDRVGSTFEEYCEILREFIRRKDTVFCDIETDGIDVRKARIRCIGLGVWVNVGRGRSSRERGRERNRERKLLITSIPLISRTGFSFWSEEQARVLRTLFMDLFETCSFVFHNGLFDTAVLHQHGLWPRWKRWEDSMVGDHEARWTDHRHRLSDLARRYTEASLWKKMVDHKEAEGDLSDAILLDYNGRDIEITAHVFDQVITEIVEDEVVDQYETDMALAPIARDMSERGLWIDEVERGRLSLAYNALEHKLIKDFVEAVGRPINPRSGDQVAEWLFGERDVGGLGLTPPVNTDGDEYEDGDDPAVNIPALFTLQDNGLSAEANRAVQLLLDIKAVNKARTTYVDLLRAEIDPAGDACEPVDVKRWAFKARKAGLQMLEQSERVLAKRAALSRLYASWQIHVVPSGRWSSSPNVQNIPKKIWELDGVEQNARRMFTSPPGHVLVGADYEQIELRIYAAITGDRYSLKAIEGQLDPHTLAAAIITADSEEEIYEQYARLAAALKRAKEPDATPAEIKAGKIAKFYRDGAKTVRYLKNYGGGGAKLFDSMRTLRNKATNRRIFKDLDRKIVTEWERRWDSRQPETAGWHASVGRFVRQHGYVASPIGDKRRRYFPDGPSKINAPPNHIIQASAAYIANQAMLKLFERVPPGTWSEHTGPCLQVHDYIAYYVPESRAEEFAQILNECMFYKMEYEAGIGANRVSGVMPFPAKAMISKSWADNE